LYTPGYQLKYWRDHNGPEVYYVIDKNHQYLPVEVKWTESPTEQDCRHLNKFLNEYACDSMAYLICRIQRPRLLSPRVMALPWQNLSVLTRAIHDQA